jgi:glycosyltransferase involved in cell wall biosynthesis
MEGVSVIICCYNSASRLEPTLSALAAQQFRCPIPWEVLLVDNASTDHTADVARVVWADLHATAPLRIVRETRPGQMHAREKGIAEAAYPILLFCDDDNWLCANYVQGMFDVLAGDRVTAACGGRGIAAFEGEKPGWFDDYAEAFATGPQDLTMEEGRLLSLYGAGLAIRKEALDELYRSGFRPLVGSGRTGNKLGSADDIELTYALVLKGYRLAYRGDLTFIHYLPTGRLTRKYLTRLFTAFGQDGPVRNLYYAHLTPRRGHQRLTNWYLHLGLSLVRIGKYLFIPPKRGGRALYLRWNIAYLASLLNLKKTYRDLSNHIGRLREPARKPALIQTTMSRS